jgi:hypothetical protein
MMRLRALGERVVPHVAEELGRFDLATRRALLEALASVDTTDARTLKKRLARAETAPSARPGPVSSRIALPQTSSAEAKALDNLRALPPPRANERPVISRERGEAHIALARAGSRLARKDLLMSLATLAPDRSRLYCEAAGLIGDADFLGPLARIADAQPEAGAALSAIAAREKITRRSKALRDLDEPLRVIVARALAAA